MNTKMQKCDIGLAGKIVGFNMTELLLLWCHQEVSLKKEYAEMAERIISGKVLNELYRDYGGDCAARLIAEEMGWL